MTVLETALPRRSSFRRWRFAKGPHPPAPGRVSQLQAVQRGQTGDFASSPDDVHLPWKAPEAGGGKSFSRNHCAKATGPLSDIAEPGRRMESGRDALIDALKAINGRYVPDTAPDRISEYEAVRIAYYHDVQAADRVLRAEQRPLTEATSSAYSLDPTTISNPPRRPIDRGLRSDGQPHARDARRSSASPGPGGGQGTQVGDPRLRGLRPGLEPGRVQEGERRVPAGQRRDLLRERSRPRREPGMGAQSYAVPRESRGVNAESERRAAGTAWRHWRGGSR
jgi:hypothetical protein